MLTNTVYEMSASFADITGDTYCIQQFIHNSRWDIEWDRILNNEDPSNSERRES